MMRKYWFWDDLPGEDFKITDEIKKNWSIAVDCGSLRGKVRWLYKREAISKNPHETLNKSGSAGIRSGILDDVNYRSESIDAEKDMIFDDFIARVEMLSRIVCAIRRTNMEIKKYLWDCSWKEREVGL